MGGKMSRSNRIGGLFLVATLLAPSSSTVSAEISAAAEAVYEWSRLEYDLGDSNEDSRVRCCLSESEPGQ